MRAISKTAEKTMDILTSGLRQVEDHKKIDNAPGAFMPVHVELIGTMGEGYLFSVAHYWEHPSGDLMADPEMVFLRGEEGRYYPTYFKQDGGPFVEQRSVHFKDGRASEINLDTQADQVDFAEMWMRNIREQQQL